MKKLLVRMVGAAILSVGLSGVTFAATDRDRCSEEPDRRQPETTFEDSQQLRAVPAGAAGPATESC